MSSSYNKVTIKRVCEWESDREYIYLLIYVYVYNNNNVNDSNDNNAVFHLHSMLHYFFSNFADEGLLS